MQIGVDGIINKDKYKYIRSYEEYKYAREVSTISLVNVETGKTDRVEKTKIKEFWDNLADDDRLDMAGWSYEAFLERLSKIYCYYLKRQDKVVAIGGTFPDDLKICLWLLVSKEIYKYPSSLISAVRKAILKDLKVYPKCMCNVIAMPDLQGAKHNKFIERVLKMEFMGYVDNKSLWAANKERLLECVSR